MLSFIFKSKVRNAFFTVFSLLCIFNLFEVFLDYWYVVQMPPLVYVITAFIYLLFLVYMATLKRQYKLKGWLFPVAFIGKCAIAAWSVYYSLETLTYDFSRAAYGMLFALINLACLVAYALCFAGALSNFKNVTLLRAGALIRSICLILLPVISILLSCDFDYNLLVPIVRSPIPFQTLLPSVFFDVITQLHFSYQTLLRFLPNILFDLSLLGLAYNRKEEYIDLAPYAEQRKAKRAARSEKRSQIILGDDFKPPQVPEGCWRCMGCGKILPDTATECECGYKHN